MNIRRVVLVLTVILGLCLPAAVVPQEPPLPVPKKDMRVAELVAGIDFCFQEAKWDKAVELLRELIDRFSEHPEVAPRLVDYRTKLLFAEFSLEFAMTARMWEGIYAGTVRSFVPKANVLEIGYEFKDDKELADFRFARRSGGGMQTAAVNASAPGMGKFGTFVSLKIPFQLPWQVEMVVQETGAPANVKIDQATPRGGVFLVFGDEDGKNGYLYAIDANFHDGRMQAPHGILKYHPGGMYAWDFMANSFSPRLVPFGEMTVKVICHTNGEMSFQVNGEVVLQTQDDSFKRGWLHFGPGNIVFKSILVKGQLDDVTLASRMNEIRERAWAARMEDFRRANGMVPPERGFGFPALTPEEAIRLIDFKPVPAATDQPPVPIEEAPVPPGPSSSLHRALARGILAQAAEGMDGWGVPAGTPVTPDTPPADAEPPPTPAVTPPAEALPVAPVPTPKADNPMYLTYCAGLKLRQDGKIDEALAKFDEVVAYHAASVPALYERAFCRYIKGDWAGARADLTTLRDLGFAYEVMAYLDVRIALEQNDAAAGLKAAALIPDGSPFAPMTRVAAGWLNYLTGDFPAADAALATAVRLDAGLAGVAAWYRNRIDAFRSGPRWVDNYTAGGHTCTVHTGTGAKAAALAAAYLDSLFGACQDQFQSLMIEADRRNDRVIKPVDVYCFATPVGLAQYLDRIVIGKDLLQAGTQIAYDARYDRVYLYTDFQGEAFKECMANAAVMTFVRNLAFDFPPWFLNGLTWYFENSQIETLDKGVFNLAGSQVKLTYISTAKLPELLNYYGFLTGHYQFPMTATVQNKKMTYDRVVLPRMIIPPPGDYQDIRELLKMDRAAFDRAIVTNKTVAGLFMHFLFRYNKGQYRAFLTTYFKGMRKGLDPDAILAQGFPAGYVDRMLKLMEWHIINLWQRDVCGSAEIPPAALLGSDFKDN
ncbi:MAG: hypothetical protein ABIF71_13960 [Planctomycetota bacterium]